MPASDTAAPDPAAINAAAPVASTSRQLQERLDREARQRASGVDVASAELRAAFSHLLHELEKEATALRKRHQSI